ncbi:DUF3742 family protein [Pseudomonas aeruginosa]|uniref:DUF3742 family protein n=1 Tax=Citrobacter freundii TaxID=546 RepID=UPI001BCFA3C1|nr:DUF3742 family protein [Citrobacter freundii]MBN0649867.1 DUF3742 family protein [Pseudomonas aeruginosa]
MNAKTHRSFPERFGYWLGRAWRAGVRVERQLSSWLVGQGLPKGLAVALLWVVKLVAAGVMLYAATGLAVVLLFAVAAAWGARNSEVASRPEAEWRNGPAGFGLYTYDGFRIDPHVSDDE